MLKKYHSYLRDIGLSELQIKLYDYIIENKSGAVIELKEELNLSYSQVNYNLSVLEDMGLIFSTKSEKNKKFYRIDPKIALTKVLEDRVKNFKKQIDKIEEKVNIEESVQGVCLKNVPFYHYSDLNLAVNNFFELIEKSMEEIVLSSLPPILIKKIEYVLYNAYVRGVQIKLYFSNADFDSINNYFDLITDILSRVKLTIIQTKERTCQRARYNDILVNVGVILIDGKYLNSISFIDGDIFHFDGFYGPAFVEQSKKFMEIKTVEKQIKVEFPEPIQTILDVIKANQPIMTRELSTQSRVGGGKLREILNFLINEGIIKESEIKGTPGKPRKEYILASRLIL